MTRYAVIKDSMVVNVIIAETLEDAELATGSSCLDIDLENELGIGHTLDDKLTKKITAAKAKKEAAAKAEADALELARVKALEIELEKSRQAEADRFAAEEALKPKPVKGIFVKVEPN